MYVKGSIFFPTVIFRKFTCSVLPICSVIPHSEHIQLFSLCLPQQPELLDG